MSATRRTSRHVRKADIRVERSHFWMTRKCTMGFRGVTLGPFAHWSFPFQVVLMKETLGRALVPAGKADRLWSYRFQIAFVGVTLGWAVVPAVKAVSLGSFPLHIALLVVTVEWALVPANKADA